MSKKTYSMFGAGAAGLYTAWRLLNGGTDTTKYQSKQLHEGDTLELYDWGQYNFSEKDSGTRAAGARVCTWHFQDDKNKSYVELGGMRYFHWDGSLYSDGPGKGLGNRIVTTVINLLNLEQYSVPFNVSTNPLLYLRTKNMYTNDISSSNPAPNNVDHYGASASPYTGFAIVSSLAGVEHNTVRQTRTQVCEFYQTGRIVVDMPESSVFNKGDLFKDIGYWNLMYDQLGSEGYNYIAAGNGYSSNVSNSNAAVALQGDNERNPGVEYKTLTKGYSSIFNALFDSIKQLAKEQGVKFHYHPNTRLHSILEIDNKIHYTLATRENPNQQSASKVTDAAWLAMPRYSIDLVAEATRYQPHQGLDVLNHKQVQLYLEAAVIQPSYKVGMFFDKPWWLNSETPYPPQLTTHEVTLDGLKALAEAGFPKKYIIALKDDPNILENAYSSTANFIKTVEACIHARLTFEQEKQLLTITELNAIGPSVTDTPIRQVVYFGNNGAEKSKNDVHGLLASYDDESFTAFWQGLELGPKGTRETPLSQDMQPLDGPRKVPPVMVKMLRKQLATLHFGPQADYSVVPEPLEAKYMDWSLPPFKAGYHVYAPHYDVGDVQRKIRKPSQLIKGKDAKIFIVGEAYSNDQGWVEGAFCTAESVLNDFFDIKPIIDDADYPFICPAVK